MGHWDSAAGQNRYLAANAPLVLLPGRAAGTPVWASNLPALLEIGDVNALDLLGEPGLSIQSRPNASEAAITRFLDDYRDDAPDTGSR